MIILGVDPGTLFTGYAVISGVNEKLELIKCDVIKIPAKNKFPIRLKQIYDSLVSVIDEFKPDEFAIETAFYGKNVQSTLKLGHARGVSILAAVNREIPTTEYAPREVKLSVSGLGAASKEQIRFMVCRIFNIKIETFSKQTDISDAIAVALCHHNKLLGSGFSKKGSTAKSGGISWKEYITNNPKKVKVQ